MAVLLTGSSGLLGTALTPLLTTAGHTVIPLRRRSSTPAPGEAVWDAAAGTIDLTQSGPLSAVVHLAGESVGQRWSAASKRRMWDSRCRGTELLCAALNRMAEPPHTLVCASATGFYGDRGEEWLEERSAAGTGFLADLTTAWEKASAQAIARGIRVVHLRFGIVLAPRGGALARMLPIFRAGLGGRLGNGRQYWSWVSLEDSLRAVLHVLSERSLDGPVNVTSPCPVTNAEFTRVLGQALHRPAVLATPRFLVELAFGEMGREALLSSARVRPARLVAAGFSFRQAELGEALRSSVGR
jgi:uncharacterized protein (TIGR01777 family)